MSSGGVSRKLKSVGEIDSLVMTDSLLMIDSLPMIDSCLTITL